MTHRTLALLGLLALGSTAVLLAGADPSPKESTRWEYAVYRSLANRFEWQTENTEIYARGLPDFFRQLGVKTAVTEPMAEVVLINHFGQQGWELIEMSPPSGTRGTWIFWFRRPRR